MNQKGFTLIELLVIMAMILIFGVMVVGQIDPNGGTLCRGGYQFVYGADGRPVQVLNGQGGGVPCEQKPSIQ